MRPPGAEKDWGIMKNSGMSETMQTLMRKSVCALLSLLLLLSAVLPVKAAAETAPIKIIRVGSFEDTFNYCNEKGARKGYGYELLQTLSGYTGWQFEYVTCDWSDCFEKLENGEIDIMGGISYTEDQKSITNMGGTMRLGAYECIIDPNSKTYEAYQSEHIQERHRHRYEFNNSYKEEFEKAGMKCVGINPESDLVEIVEIPTLKWFIGTQFHPEYSSTVLKPHPLFLSFIKAAISK